MLGALLLVASICASAQGSLRGQELRVVTADDSTATRQIVASLRRQYPVLQENTDPKVLAARKGAAVYLAIGPAALRAALAADLEGPVVSVFTSSQTYADVTSGARPKRAVTAIFAEASPAHQMQLISRLFGRRVTVGVLITANTAALQPLLRQAARNAGLGLEIEFVEPDENILRALTRLASTAAILAVPDSTLYTPANLRGTLESTYRRNQPVIGFSTSLVAAGTMATAYSTIDDVVAQLDEVLEAGAAGRAPEPQFPRYWRVAINENVARSLNIVITDEIRALGDRPPERPR